MVAAGKKCRDLPEVIMMKVNDSISIYVPEYTLLGHTYGDESIRLLCGGKFPCIVSRARVSEPGQRSKVEGLVAKAFERSNRFPRIIL